MCNLRIWLLLLLGLAPLRSAAFPPNSTEPFPALLDPKRPSVYLEFLQTKAVAPLLNGEPSERVYLALTNNTRWSITVRAFDVPKEYGEIGLFFEVESDGLTPDKTIPRGYSWDTASLVGLDSGRKFVFSLPRNDLDLGLAIRVDFNFDWERNRSTRHSAYFRYWDLPERLRDKEREKKLLAPSAFRDRPEYDSAPLPKTLGQPNKEK